MKFDVVDTNNNLYIIYCYNQDLQTKYILGTISYKSIIQKKYNEIELDKNLNLSEISYKDIYKSDLEILLEKEYDCLFLKLNQVEALYMANEILNLGFEGVLEEYINNNAKLELIDMVMKKLGILIETQFNIYKD